MLFSGVANDERARGGIACIAHKSKVGELIRWRYVRIGETIDHIVQTSK